jgi:transcriptional regulator with XRE-family HTH domain
MTDRFLEAYSIGLKLRTLRIGKRLTLSRLAAETKLSTALLSKLETNRMVPTLPTIAKICRVYGVGLGYFFADIEEHSLAITRKANLSSSGRSQPAIRTVPLHVQRPDANMTASIVEFSPGATTTRGGSGIKSEITAYVIDGMLEIDVGGEKEELQPGDCAVLNTSGLVIFGAQESTGCRALIVNVTI